MLFTHENKLLYGITHKITVKIEIHNAIIFRDYYYCIIVGDDNNETGECYWDLHSHGDNLAYKWGICSMLM